MIRTLLVDDEQPARERMRQMLATHADVEVIGEAADGEEAMERIAELRPDLVFLDVQMPASSGMEVAASLPSPRPQIVFCTAYDQYAVDAFELHAVDYLLKPITRARLSQALDRVRRESASAADPDRERSIDSLGRAAGGPPLRFLGRRGTRFCVVPGEDVLYFASEGGQTKLQTREHHYWMQPTLGELAERIDPRRFFRISRGAIVCLDAVREVIPEPGGQGEVRLLDGTRLEVSRRRFKDLMDRLSG